MKTLVVSGARSGVGKTALARKICAVLPGSVHVKLGHGRRKSGIDNVFYPAGTPIGRVLEQNAGARFLVIESNSILDKFDPDLALYIPGDDAKASAGRARVEADIICGEGLVEDHAALIASRLELAAGTAERIAGAAREAARRRDP